MPWYFYAPIIFGFMLAPFVHKKIKHHRIAQNRALRATVIAVCVTAMIIMLVTFFTPM